MGDYVMKTLLLAIMLSLPVGAVADEPEPPTAHEICQTRAMTAETIMMARQMGMPINEILDVFDADSPWRVVVLETYRKPRWSSAERAERAVEEVYNEFYTSCKLRLKGK